MSGDAAFTPKEGKKSRTIEDFEKTTIANYFELWRDFDGKRLPVLFDRDWLDVIAIHDKDRISIAVTNMGGRQIAVDLSKVANQIEATAVTQMRLNYHKGEVVFEPAHDVDVSAVPVDVNETTVIRLKPKNPLAPSKTLKQERNYAVETAVKSDGSAQDFQIKVDSPGDVVFAKLNIGIHRRSFNEALKVVINGKPIEVDSGDAGEFTEFFAPLDAIVPVSILKENNTIQITAQKNATITSVQLLTHRK